MGFQRAEAVVAARHGADAPLAHLLIGADRVLHLVEHVVALGDLAGDAPFGGLVRERVDDADRRRQIDVLLLGLQHVEGLIGRVVGVVDDVDAVLEREPHRLVGPGVGDDVDARLARDLHRRRDLGIEIGDPLRLSGTGELVARDVDLQVVHALAHAEAAGLAHLVRPVGDVTHRFLVHVPHALVAEPA